MENALPHERLVNFDKRLWTLEGRLPKGPMSRNMVVYKMDDGGVLIHSCITVHDGTQRQIESLGKPKVLIVPSPLHRLDAPAYKKEYPDILVVAPKAAIAKVSEKVKVDGSCEELLPKFKIGVHAIPGLKPTELAYELALQDGGKALVVNDALMNIPHIPSPGGWLLRLIGSTGFFGMTRLGKMMLLQDKKAFRAWLEQWAADPKLKLITMSHGLAVDENVSEKIRQAAARL